MTEKISTLVLKVDLNCPECYKKIKKVLCKFYCEIRSQTFDKKQNTVTISGPFDPNCFSKKLCCKAGKSIKSIEIIQQTPKQNPPPKAPEPAPKAPDQQAPKEPEPAPKPPKEPTPAPKAPEPAPPPAPKPKAPEVPAPKEPGPKHDQPIKIVVVEPVPVQGYPPKFGVCCGECYQGHGGGPCYQLGLGGYGYGYGRPPTCFDGPPPCFYDGRNRGYVTCDYYFSEENATSCTIM